MTADSPASPSLFSRQMLICVFTSFCLRSAAVSADQSAARLVCAAKAWISKTIGLFALIQLLYTWKFIWSPLMDRFTCHFWAGGRLDADHPVAFDRQHGRVLACFAAAGYLVDCRAGGGRGVFSASQDIVLDAYRRESCCAMPSWGWATPCTSTPTGWPVWFARLAVADSGRPAALAVGVRHHCAVHAAGLAAHPGGQRAGLARGGAKTLRDAVVMPFKEFISRQGWQGAAWGAGLYLFVQAGRQHGHCAGHAVLSGHRF